MTKQKEYYLELLTAMIHTRLVFNTIAETEKFFGVNCLNNNSVKRAFSDDIRCRNAFHDVMMDVSQRTAGVIDLSELLPAYERVSELFKNFSRCKDPKSIALEVLYYAFQLSSEKKSAKRLIYRELYNILDVALMVLMLLGALPPYSSRKGDVKDFDVKYREVLRFLEDDFVKKNSLDFIEELPVIEIAKNADNKCRVLLIYFVYDILYTYNAFKNSSNVVHVSDNIKQAMYNLDIGGYWYQGDCERSTTFWHVEQFGDAGCYRLTRYRKMGHELERLRYTFTISDKGDGCLEFFVMHPKCIKNLVEKKPIGDDDCTWYLVQKPNVHNPDELYLINKLRSRINDWKMKLEFKRVKDDEWIETLERWREFYAEKVLYPDCECVFYHRGVYAVTREYLYVMYGDDKERYLRVPRNAVEGMERIGLDSNVGVLYLGSKGAVRKYLAFDDMLLYIPFEDYASYGIEEVDAIV